MAIDEILDEHEQSERVLQWLRDNGVGLIGGIALGLAAIGGWKWWGIHQQQVKIEEADRYSIAVDAIDANAPNAAELAAGLQPGLLSTLAGLELAQSQVGAGETEAAIATLKGLGSDDPALAAVINQRLARLQIEAGEAEAALALLADADSAGALEIRGDAEFALGRHDEARASYEKALAQMDVGSPLRRMLELKLTEVGGTPDEAEAEA
ncbi:YfgM family protein [Marilutibacter alkalisoli]|uniref:Ancillary SecYEG translocon subunit n=1 Tax=Marilutibacter alkalisoli TaxID=2591633 RepID=A0A514BRU5_9GAMM|nr:tetratricopeptide repeat protein [Lysobacter alkalisoli]QDH70080.1 tetratricopeptide repeat protein [Lysobacter alkalisoli]